MELEALAVLETSCSGSVAVSRKVAYAASCCFEKDESSSTEKQESVIDVHEVVLAGQDAEVERVGVHQVVEDRDDRAVGAGHRRHELGRAERAASKIRSLAQAWWAKAWVRIDLVIDAGAWPPLAVVPGVGPRTAEKSRRAIPISEVEPSRNPTVVRTSPRASVQLVVHSMRTKVTLATWLSWLGARPWPRSRTWHTARPARRCTWRAPVASGSA